MRVRGVELRVVVSITLRVTTENDEMRFQERAGRDAHDGGLTPLLGGGEGAGPLFISGEE